jgi:hypothetical protein
MAAARLPRRDRLVSPSSFVVASASKTHTHTAPSGCSSHNPFVTLRSHRFRSRRNARSFSRASLSLLSLRRRRLSGESKTETHIETVNSRSSRNKASPPLTKGVPAAEEFRARSPGNAHWFFCFFFFFLVRLF